MVWLKQCKLSWKYPQRFIGITIPAILLFLSKLFVPRGILSYIYSQCQARINALRRFLETDSVCVCVHVSLMALLAHTIILTWDLSMSDFIWKHIECATHGCYCRVICFTVTNARLDPSLYSTTTVITLKEHICIIS